MNKCRAITTKKIQCSRVATKNGLCSQHNSLSFMKSNTSNSTNSNYIQQNKNLPFDIDFSELKSYDNNKVVKCQSQNNGDSQNPQSNNINPKTR